MLALAGDEDPSDGPIQMTAGSQSVALSPGDVLIKYSNDSALGADHLAGPAHIGPAFPGFAAMDSAQDSGSDSSSSLTPAYVVSATVNGNLSSLTGVQRSMVDSMLYTFSEPVTLDPSDAFSLAVASGQSGTVPTLTWTAVSPDASGASTQWAVSFSGASVVASSVADGVYDLTLNSSAVTSEANPTIAAQPHQPDLFYRLFGDYQGTGRVNGSDYNAFLSTYSKGSGDIGFIPCLDFNADGLIDSTDNTAFQANFNRRLTGTLSFSPTDAEPTNVTATANDPTSVTLTWTAPATGTVTGYDIQRWSVADGAWITIAQNIPASTTSYTDTTADPDTDYQYQVNAVQTAGTSDWSEIPAELTTQPSMPASLTATAVSPTEIDLAWENDDPNATAIQVLWSTGGAPFQALPLLDGSSSGYPDTGLTPNTLYSFEVITEGPGGSSTIATAQASTPSVDAPIGLAATGVSTSEIYLQWTNNSTTATGIEIDRSSDGGPFAPIVTGLPSDTTNYPDTTGLEDDEQYSYEAKATGGSSGASSFSPPASAWTIAAAPSGLSASAPSSFEVDLNWTNNSSGSPTFTIERSTGGSPFTPIDTTAAGATSYQDLTVTDNATYTYQVVAVNGAGVNSAASNAVTVSTPQAAFDGLTATAVSTSEIDLAWTDNSGGTTAVQVWRSPDGETFSPLVTLPAGTISYQDLGLPEATGYFYAVQPVSSSFAVGLAGQAVAVTFPAAPSGLTATASGESVDLAWVNNSNNPGGFDVLRSTDGTSFSMIDSVPAGTTTYEDLGAPDGSMDYYEVIAFTDGGGDSTPTAIASADPVAALRLTDDTPQTGLTYQVLHGQTLTIGGAGVLSNDVDPNGYAFNVGSNTNPAHGSLTLNSEGSFSYLSDADFTGIDSFTYTATDQANATSNTATVQIQVTDNMPEASSAKLPVVEATDSQGNYLPYPGPVSGTLQAGDPDGDTITYSAMLVSGPGNFSYDPSTGNYTYTPSQSDQGAALIVFTANDGALTSNKASLIFPGWKIDTTDPDEPDYDGDDFVDGQALPTASNQYFSVNQGGSLQVDASAGLLSAATDTDDPTTDTDTLAVDSTLIESPQHGAVTINNGDGSFNYTPNPGFVGRDFFTWQVADGAKKGNYATAFIDVQPVTVSISIGSLKQGEPTAQIPNDQFPPDANGDPQYATIDLNTSSLPDGSTVTLSVNSDVQSNLDVYDGIPGQSGTNLLFGKDAGSDSYTWTLGGSQTPPSAVYAVGLAGTDYDQAVFTLSVSIAQQTVGNPPAGQPAAAPGATQPIAATQKASVPGKKGFLEALDGTTNVETDNTNVRQFFLNYGNNNKKYHRGVANSIDHPQPFGGLAPFIAGDREAFAIECQAWDQLQKFYDQNPANLIVSLDAVGYSRGAMEAAKLVSDVLDAEFLAIQTKVTDRSDPSNPKVVDQPFHPTVRFVGLISPVMGPFEIQGFWPHSLPAGPAWFYQALDNEPNNFFLPQHDISRDPQTRGSTVDYPDGHSQVGHDRIVLADMLAEAKLAGAPVS